MTAYPPTPGHSKAPGHSCLITGNAVLRPGADESIQLSILRLRDGLGATLGRFCYAQKKNYSADVHAENVEPTGTAAST